MPKAGMSMESGTILKWLKQEGDEVKVGEPLLEIETDKVAMEVESEASGVLLHIVRREGEEVPVTEAIAYIGQSGEEVAVRPASATQPTGDRVSGLSTGDPNDRSTTVPAGRSLESPERRQRVAATPLARTLATERNVDLSAVSPSGPRGEVKARDIVALADATDVKASPLARRLAGIEGVDLAGVAGSGRAGKILKRDVLGRAARPSGPGREASRRAMSSTRKTIARRMAESHATIPPVTLNTEADVTDLIALKRDIEGQTGNQYSLNDFLLRGTTLALQSHRELMQQLDGDELVQPERVHLGVAVSVEDLLLVPVVRGADSLSFGELAKQAHELIDRARSRTLGPDDLTGATFTITNLGMYGIIDFTPIINPPESAILGVGTIRDSLQLWNEKIETRKKISLSLTIDHRVIDGVAGAKFLAELRETLERPLRLLA